MSEEKKENGTDGNIRQTGEASDFSPRSSRGVRGRLRRKRNSTSNFVKVAEKTKGGHPFGCPCKAHGLRTPHILGCKCPFHGQPYWKIKSCGKAHSWCLSCRPEIITPSVRETHRKTQFGNYAPMTLRIMSEPERAWFGAIIDGEGWLVQYKERPYAFKIGIGNTSMEIMSAILRLSQAGKVYARPKRKGEKLFLSWFLGRYRDIQALIFQCSKYSEKLQILANRLTKVPR